MNRDPLGLGFLLYGFAPQPAGPAALTAAGISLTLIPDGHEGCSISTFCRNPLHPGPCAGWKKKLGIEAPGALHAIEQAHKEKVAAKRAATAEAKSAAAKTLTSRHHVSPLHAKKALVKRANMLLGHDEGKASGKADKVILNKQEIKKYSKIKAAQVNGFRTKHGLQEDPGLEDRIAEALAHDNKGGKDDAFRAAIAGSAESMAAQLAVEHCHKGNHKQCDDQVLGQLREHLTGLTEGALLTGDDAELDQALADWDAGKLDLGPAKATAADLKAAEKAAWSPHSQTVESTLAAFDKLGHDDFKSLDAPTRAKAVEILKQMANNPNMPEKERTKAADIAAKWTAPGMATFPLGTKNQLDLSKAVYTGTLDDIAKAHGALSEAEKKGLPKAHQPAIDKALQHAKNKAKAAEMAKAAQLADAKAKAGDLMDAAKAKTDKLAEDNKAKAAKLAENKAKAAAMMDAAKAKVDKLADAKAKAAEPAKAADVVPQPPDGLTATQAALWDKLATGKATLIKNNGEWWISENGGPIKKAPKAMADALAKKGAIEHKSTGSGGTEKWGVVLPSENAKAAQKGMQFGLGLHAWLKGNKSLGTKAAQQAFADKIQAHLDGDPAKEKTLKVAADQLAGSLENKAKIHVGNQQTQKVIHVLLAEEIEKGLKGEDGPFPLVDAFKKGADAHALADIEASKAAVLDIFKQKAAEQLGVDVNLPAPVVAAKVLFKPGEGDKHLLGTEAKKRLDVIDALTPEHWAQLDPAEHKEITGWLAKRAALYDTGGPHDHERPEVVQVAELQGKLGLPTYQTQWQQMGDGDKLKALLHDPKADKKDITDLLKTISGEDLAQAKLTTAEQAQITSIVKDHMATAPPQHVKDLKDAIATDAPSWQIKQAAEKVSVAEVKKHLTADEQAKLKAAQDAPAAKPFDALGAEPKLDFEHVVADDADPSHKEVVDAVELMTKDDWDGFAPHEKSNLITAVADAKAAGQPGAFVVGNKIKAWADEDGLPTDGASGADVSPGLEAGHVQLPDGATVDLHKMFAEDGDPNHEQVVEAIDAMTKDDWDALAPWEKGNLQDHIKDAGGAGEPGAEAGFLKVNAWVKDDKANGTLTPGGKPYTGPTAAPPPPATLGPDAKAAAGYATGATSGTAKTKLAAYEKVSGEEFQQLPEVTQKAMLADLKAVQAKFLDPKKKKQAQDQHDYLSGFIGGPAAPSSGGAASDEEKLNAASGVLADMIEVVGDAPDINKAVASGTKILATAQANGSYDQLAEQMGIFQGTIGMEKLAKKHTLNPDAVKEITPKLQADVTKKLHASTEPTPVYDAWFKAMQTGDPADLKALEKAAGSSPLVAKAAPASDHEQGMVKGNTYLATSDAWFGKIPPDAFDPAVAKKQVEEALSEGVGSPKHQAWAKTVSEHLAKVTLDSAFEGMDWSSADEAKIPPAVKVQAEAALGHLYEQNLLSTDPYTDNKASNYLYEAVQEINKASGELAAAQGWDVNSPQVKEYEHAIFQAKLENLPKLYPLPAPVHAPSSPATSAGPVQLGHGSTTTFTDEQQQILTGTIKALNVNLSSSSTTDWDALVAAAQAHAGKDGLPDTLSVMDVLNAVDAGHAKNLGVPNTGKLREKVLNWLKTPAGKKYAEDNAAPKAKLLSQMTGELSIKLPPGVKIQPTSGPGKYDPNYEPNDGQWKKITWQQAIAEREAYWAANPGTKWTPQAEEALKSYTLGSATMNNWLRGETSQGTPVLTASHATKQAVLDVQSAMIPMQTDMLLKRGTGWEQFPPGFRDPESVKKLIGKNITEKAFLSTSVTGGGSEGFGGAVKLEIEAPKGTHGIMVEDISHFKGGKEQEMILAAGTVMRILSVKQNGGTTVVRVRVVTPK